MRWLIQWDEITQRLISFFRSTFQFVEDTTDTCWFQRKIPNQERVPDDAWNKRYTVPVAGGWGGLCIAWHPLLLCYCNPPFEEETGPSELSQRLLGLLLGTRKKLTNSWSAPHQSRSQKELRYASRSSSLLISKVSSWVVALPNKQSCVSSLIIHWLVASSCYRNNKNSTKVRKNVMIFFSFFNV